MAQELVDDLKKGGALITLEDLAQYNVVERKPVIGTFHNYTILSAPPPSSGGVVLVSALNILEGYDLASSATAPPHRCTSSPKPIAAPTWIAPITWAIPTTTTFPWPSSPQRSTPRPGGKHFAR